MNREIQNFEGHSISATMHESLITLETYNFTNKRFDACQKFCSNIKSDAGWDPPILQLSPRNLRTMKMFIAALEFQNRLLLLMACSAI